MLVHLARSASLLKGVTTCAVVGTTAVYAGMLTTGAGVVDKALLIAGAATTTGAAHQPLVVLNMTLSPLLAASTKLSSPQVLPHHHWCCRHCESCNTRCCAACALLVCAMYLVGAQCVGSTYGLVQLTKKTSWLKGTNKKELGWSAMNQKQIPNPDQLDHTIGMLWKNAKRAML